MYHGLGLPREPGVIGPAHLNDRAGYKVCLLLSVPRGLATTSRRVGALGVCGGLSGGCGDGGGAPGPPPRPAAPPA